MIDPETLAELERLIPIAQDMVRDAKPRPPEGEGWIFRSSCRECDWPSNGPPFGLQHGDYTEAMLHGGTTIVGNLLSSIHWSSVTAFKRHDRSAAPWEENLRKFRGPRDGWPA